MMNDSIELSAKEVSFTNGEIITLELILEKYNFLEWDSSEIGYDPEMGKDVDTILQKIRGENNE